MKNIPTLIEYYEQHNVDVNTSSEEKERLKKEHRKLYLRQYEQQRRQFQKRIEHRLSPEEYRVLKRFAKEHKAIHLSPFMKQCAFAYLEEQYLDRDPKQTQKIIAEIRKCGQNINQVVQTMHAIRAYQDATYYQRLCSEVTTLIQRVEIHLLAPPKVEDWIDENLDKWLENNPHQRQELLKRLSKSTTKIETHDSKIKG